MNVLYVQKTTLKATIITKQSADESKTKFPTKRFDDFSCLHTCFQKASCSKNIHFMVNAEKTVRQKFREQRCPSM